MLFDYRKKRLEPWIMNRRKRDPLGLSWGHWKKQCVRGALPVTGVTAVCSIVERSEQIGFCLRNVDLTGTCFKCGEQYIYKDDNS
jgi:hypothetical protein